MASKISIREFSPFILLILAIVSILFTSAITNRNAAALDTVPVKISALLSDYSQNIGNLADKKFLQSKNYSPEMKMLIIDRQNYYQEFFEKGLHSVLVGLESQFITNKDATISLAGNLYKVHTLEQVTMHGKPIVTLPDDYPLIQAAKWAIKQTNNIEVKNRLNEYIESMTDGVEKSAVQGVRIVFLVNHDMEIRVENGQATILKDTLSDIK